MNLSSLLKDAAGTLGATVEETDGMFVLGVPLADDDGNPTRETEGEELYRTWLNVWENDDEGVVNAFSTLGDLSDEVDLAEGLRHLAGFNYPRLRLSEKEEGGEELLVESTLPSGALDAAAMLAMLKELSDAAFLMSDLCTTEVEE